MGFIKWAIMGTAMRELLQQSIEHTERKTIFQRAREHADMLGKPLLVVGSPKIFPYSHPCGDVTIDIDPDLKTYCDYQIADVRKIPYPSNSFGAAYISHVLEHLPNIEDAWEALSELHRVAAKVFVVSPHKSSIMAWLAPGHHLWVTAAGDDFIIEQRGVI